MTIAVSVGGLPAVLEDSLVLTNLFVQKQNSNINGGNRKNTEESLDLDDIDKICREIDEEEKRKKRKRGYPQDETNSIPVSISSGFSSSSDFDTVRSVVHRKTYLIKYFSIFVFQD